MVSLSHKQCEPLSSIAEMVAQRLMALLKTGRLQRVDIDIIRGACEIAAHYECYDADEFRQLEDKALRKLIGKVG